MLRIEKKRLKRIFEAMRSRSIMVIGDLMLDQYIWGRVERISPEAPVPVVEVQEERFKLGGAGNVANNLLSLGAAVRIAAVTGSDRNAETLLGILKDLGIPTDYLLPDPTRKTTVKTRIIAQTQQVARIDREERALVSGALREQIISCLKDSLLDVDAIIISDYGKGVVQIAAESGQQGEDEAIFSTLRACSGCGRSFEEPDPRLFSFNSKHGWCPS
ncbi:MAG: PfkB family carbohydrate kinase, partial [Desulfomonilia bacterium]|nr:PfkB family carbohydrate kinase [Desulfomonilia bacterium]